MDRSETANPFSLAGKVILVTGASSGIGRETCAAVARAGGTVIATGRDQSRLDETLAILDGAGHRAITADLTLPADRTSLIGELASLDGIVHAAGITAQVPFRFLSEKHLGEIHRINYEAPILLTQMILKNRAIADGGSIVFITSTAAFLGLKALTAYSASKGAVTAAARVLALELAPRKIRCNCVAPAMVETPMASQTEAAVSAETMNEHRKLYPLGFGKPEDVGNTTVFLLADSGRWITGTTIVLDGGYSCQ
jgi:NAD(P)-dependent dehydrogenase (short-subunit alcohol dehydrogenase family)